MATYGRLIVHSEGGNRVTEVTDFLSALDHSYNSIYVFERIVDNALRHRYPWPLFEPGLFELSVFPTRRPFSGRYFRDWPPPPGAIRTYVGIRDRLIIRSAEFHSPGFWEFIGALNPLEVLRKYLQDAHERRKDREYREDHEQRLFEFEERLKQTELWRKQVELMKELGATEEDLAPMKNALLREPLEKLDVFKDRRIIGPSDPDAR